MVDFDQHRVGGLHLDASSEALRLGHEEVVAHDLHTVAFAGREPGPAKPIVLVESVLDGQDGVLVQPSRIEVGQSLAVNGLPVDVVSAVTMEFGAGHIKRDAHLFGGIPGGFNGSNEVTQPVFIGGEVGCEPSLVTDAAQQTVLAQFGLEGVVGFHARAQPFSKGVEAVRHDHEFLNVNVGSGVCSAVEDVHHRDGHQAARDTADIAPDRQLVLCSASMQARQGCTEGGVGPQACLVAGAVKLDDGLVKHALVVHRHAHQGLCDVFGHRGHRSIHAFAQPRLTAIAEFHGFVAAGGGT